MSRASDALEHVRHYSGHFPFLLDMKRKSLKDASWVPSDRQATAILRCMAYENVPKNSSWNR